MLQTEVDIPPTIMLFYVTKPPFSGGYATENDMEFPTRSLSHQESRVVLALSERGRRETTRGEIINLLGVSPKAADNVIESLRRKGWIERAAWGEYLLIPPEQGPDALGDSNLLALASRITSRLCFIMCPRLATWCRISCCVIRTGGRFT